MTALAHERADAGAARWGVAAALAALAHAGAVWAALHVRPSSIAPSEPPPAVLIELAPAPAAPQTPPSDVAPGPEVPQAEPPRSEEKLGETPEAAPTPAPAEQSAKTVENQETPSEPTKPDVAPVPDLQTSSLPAPAVLPRPAKAATPSPPRPLPSAAPRRVAETAKPSPRRAEQPVRPRAVRQERPLAKPANVWRQASAPPSVAAPSAFTAAAPATSVSQSSAAALASWKGALLAHIDRFKRYPAGANGVGTAYVVFTINGSGVVTSARLRSSSGDSILDSEAVALLRRASPAPPPPAGGMLTLNLPIRFNHD